VRAQTGEELWSTGKFKGVVGQYSYDSGDKTMVMVNFVPSAPGALFSGFKNQIVRINMTNGEILWENTYIGRAEKKVITGEFIFELNVVDDKVFLRMNGMQVYDYNTGKNIWAAAFDFTPDRVVGKPIGVRDFGVYGAVADPLIDGDYIYVLDMINRRKQFVKKYHLHTGELVWTSPEIDDTKAIPGMSLVDGKIMLQIGGVVEKQYVTVDRTGNGITTTYTVEFENVKPCGIQCLDASTGNLVWESERFKKGITNGIVLGDNYIVCSGKELYSLDISTGAEKYSVPVSKGGVGLATQIQPFKDNTIVVIGEKGVSTFDAQAGDLLNSGKYRKSFLEGRVGDIVVMKTEKADIGTFDLNTCVYKDFKARTGAQHWLSTDGNFVYVFDKKVVTKLSTQ
jgi:outer membrane protein assembly factor BamB